MPTSHEQEVPGHGTFIVEGKENVPFEMMQQRDDPESVERRNVMNDPKWRLIKASNNICPRCGGDVPVPGRKGEYPGAASRTDNATEVCSACGTEEAYEQLPFDNNLQLTPQTEWPVDPETTRRNRRPRADWNASRGMVFSAAAPRPMPKEVPDLRLHLLDHWVEGGTFWRTVEMRLAAYSMGGGATFHANIERRTLTSASLWWIKQEMLELTIAAAPVIPADVTGQDVVDALPDPFGMVVLEQPWIGMDAESPDKKIQVDVFTWGLSHVDGTACLSLSSYRYLDFGSGMNSPEMQEALQTGVLFQALQEARVTSGGNKIARLRGGSWMFLGRTDWPLTDNVAERLPDWVWETRTDQRLASQEEDRRLVAAFSVLIQAKLSERDVIYAQRPVRRRAERAGITDRKISNVTLVRLREHRKDGEEESVPGDGTKQVGWSHRWVSKGHLGWRFYGPGKRKRRLVFISPSIKGPEDLPLVIKEKVNLWVR